MAELPPILDRQMSALRLRPLRLEDERAVHTAQRVMAADDFEFAFDLAIDTDWPSYVAEHARLRSGLDLPPDRVPVSFLVATSRRGHRLGVSRFGTSSMTGCWRSAGTSDTACCHPSVAEGTQPRFCDSL